jgi:hypothetical protein
LAANKAGPVAFMRAKKAEEHAQALRRIKGKSADAGLHNQGPEFCDWKLLWLSDKSFC